MIDPLLSRAVALAFAALLVAAAWHKYTAHDRFVAALGEYRLLPEVLWKPTARAIAALEAALGVAWLADAWPVAVAGATAALLVAYATAMAINLIRGRVHMGCGCGIGRSSLGDPPLTWWLVGRNLVLAATAVLAALPRAQRELLPYDWLTLTLVLVACAVLHSAVAQLLGNASVIASWSRPRD
jgi:hypothetical protein